MTALPPIRARWTGEAFVPGRAQASLLQEALAVGEVVTLDAERGRSMASHAHQFAWLRDAWASLPERYAGYPWAASPDALRKFALIRTGWGEAAQVDCGSPAAARRVHPVMLTQAMRANGYAEAVLRGPVLTLLTPRSQSLRAMGASDFAKSKEDVLGFVADLIGVAPDDLRRDNPAA